MSSYLDSYAPEALKRNAALLSRELSASATPQAKPRAFLLGGQSGAGKTRLHKLCGNLLDNNAIVITGDEYRRSHPHFSEIQERYGMDAPAHTAKWAGEMTEALINAFSVQRYNLII